MLHILAGDHETVLPDVGVVDLRIRRSVVGDVVAEAAGVHHLEGVAAGAVLRQAAGSGEHEGVHRPDDVDHLRSPALHIRLNLGDAELAVGIVLVGEAGDGVALVPQGVGNLLGPGYLLVVILLTDGTDVGGVAAVAEDALVAGDGQNGPGAPIAEVGMLGNKVLQNGHKVIVAHQGLAGGVDVLRLDVAVSVDDQLVGEAVALGVGLVVAVAVHHVLKVVDHGLGEHHGLLALRQENGVHHELLVAVQIGVGGNEAIKVHQHIAVGVQLVQNLGEFAGGDEIFVVAAAQLRVLLGPGHVLDEDVEAQVGNQGGVLVFHQRILGGLILGPLGGDLRVLGQVADGFQLFDGLVVVIARGQNLGLLHDPLALSGQLLRLGDGGVQLALRVLVVNLAPLDDVGQGTENEGQHQDQAHADRQRRQIHLLEDLGAALSSAAAGIVRVHRFLPLLLVEHGAKVKVEEFGKNIGGFQLGKLGHFRHFYGLAGLLLLPGGLVFGLLVIGFLVPVLELGGRFLVVRGLLAIVFLALVLLRLRILRLLNLRAVLLRLLPALLRLRRLFLAHVQKIVQTAVQIKVLLPGPLVLGGQAQLFIGKFVHIQIIVIRLIAREGLGVKAVSFIEIEIDVKIFLCHWCIPTFMV